MTRHRFVRTLLAIAIPVLLSAAPAAAQSCCGDIPLSVVCTGTGQHCDRPVYVTIGSDGPATLVLTASPGLCSPVSFDLFVDGDFLARTAFLGAGESSAAIDLGSFTGTRTISVDAVGGEGGCNSGVLRDWAATLHVCTTGAPRVIEHPHDVSTCEGSGAWFWVIEASGGPDTYQWYMNGLALTDEPGRYWGSQRSVLIVSAVQPSQHNSLITCAITNACGEQAITSAAVLRVNDGDPPRYVREPENTAACRGADFQLAVNATADTVVSYLWLKDGAALPPDDEHIEGVHSPTLTIRNARPADAGDYSCTASVPCAPVAVSSIATVAVVDCTLCLSDFNRDGGVDGTDVGALFTAWESGDVAADVNHDGGVDGSDLELFFIHWETGC